jgi:hypothetical protein
LTQPQLKKLENGDQKTPKFGALLLQDSTSRISNSKVLTEFTQYKYVNRYLPVYN